MLHRYLLRFDADQFLHWRPSQLHGLMASWLDTPQFGEPANPARRGGDGKVHSSVTWACGPLVQHAGYEVAIEVATLADVAHYRLSAALGSLENDYVILGRDDIEDPIELFLVDVAELETVSWDELVESNWTSSAARLKMRSPASFSTEGIPKPDRLLRGLAQTWSTLTGLAEPRIGGIDVTGKTANIIATEMQRSVSGFKTTVEAYEGIMDFDYRNADKDGQKTMTQLLNLSRFAGIGRDTKKGFGRVSVEFMQ